jgi:hypothetical protein
MPAIFGGGGVGGGGGSSESAEDCLIYFSPGEVKDDRNISVGFLDN